MFSPTESPMMRATVPSKSTATATKTSSFWGDRGESGLVTPVPCGGDTGAPRGPEEPEVLQSPGDGAGGAEPSPAHHT